MSARWIFCWDSCGEIRCTDGMCIKIPDSSGGSNVWHIALICMMLSALIISVDLMNIMRFHMVTRMQNVAGGKKGPGMDLFRTVSYRLGHKDIIAEDLGFMTDSVKRLVEESGYPNMKVIEFAFDERGYWKCQ